MAANGGRSVAIAIFGDTWGYITDPSGMPQSLGPVGVKYNEFFKTRSRELAGKGDPTAQQVMQVRDEAIAKFGLGSCRP